MEGIPTLNKNVGLSVNPAKLSGSATNDSWFVKYNHSLMLVNISHKLASQLVKREYGIIEGENVDNSITDN